MKRSGVYAEVYLYSDHVIKTQRIFNESGDLEKYALMELSCLKTFQHPNIINLIDIEILGDYVNIKLGYMEHDLEEYIIKHGNSKIEFKRLSKQLLSGVKYINSFGIKHGDIKPSNILYDNHDIKICDFNLSTMSIPYTTPAYMSYNLLKGDDDPYSDMWATGCVIYFILTEGLLFKGKNYSHLKKLVFKFMKNPTLNLKKTKIEHWEKFILDLMLKKPYIELVEIKQIVVEKDKEIRKIVLDWIKETFNPSEYIQTLTSKIYDKCDMKITKVNAQCYGSICYYIASDDINLNEFDNIVESRRMLMDVLKSIDYNII